MFTDSNNSDGAMRRYSRLHAQFLLRWAALNACLALASFCVLLDPIVRELALTSIRRIFIETTEPDRLIFAMLRVTALALFPLNAAYLFLSLYLYVMREWEEHRFYWFLLMMLTVAWSVVFTRQFWQAAAFRV